jgi:phosphate transport system permease protein
MVHKLTISVELSPQVLRLSESASREEIKASNRGYKKAIEKALFKKFSHITTRQGKKDIIALISNDARLELKQILLKNPELLGKNIEATLTFASYCDLYLKGKISKEKINGGIFKSLSRNQAEMLDQLKEEGKVTQVFNKRFFTASSSNYPESAGILGALIGSFFMVVVCVMMAFPIGVFAAIYLEEFAPKSRLTNMIEISINNLAAVPSIVYGLLGLSLFINFLGLPRSSPLVGGLTLGLLVLPIIVISARMALANVPAYVKNTAKALGATPVQVLFHHSLPIAMPSIMTGAILSIARILGETAPLLMIGMLVFISNLPTDPLQPSTALPAQIYLWSQKSHLGFVEKTSAAIMVMLLLLVFLNLLANFIRKKFEIKW